MRKSPHRQPKPNNGFLRFKKRRLARSKPPKAEQPAPSTAPTSTAAPATVDGADTASADSLADLDARIDGAGRSLDAADTATRQATDALNTDNEGTIP